VTLSRSAYCWSESVDCEDIRLTSDDEGRDGAIAPSALCAARLMSARGCQCTVCLALCFGRCLCQYLPSTASPPHETCIAGWSRGLLWAALSPPAMRCRKWTVPDALTQAALTVDDSR
jgi:hypothetical protein